MASTIEHKAPADGPHVAPTTLDATMLSRTRGALTEIVVLPRSIDGIVGVYSQGSLFLVKELRAAGINAAFLDESEHRRFEVKKGDLTNLVVTFVLGIASTGAWEALKVMWGAKFAKEHPLDVTFVRTDRLDVSTTAWRVVGSTGDVLAAMDRLQQDNQPK